MKKLLLGIFALSLVAVSCKKDEDDSPSKTQLLTNGSSKTWKINKALIDGQDVTSIFDDCTLDDNFIFRSDFTYEENEGETKCDSADAQIGDTGVWAFAENETKLISISDGEADTVNIVALSESSFNISMVEDGQTQELRFVKK